MAKNEKSSKELASLAGKVLQQKSSTEAARSYDRAPEGSWLWYVVRGNGELA